MFRFAGKYPDGSPNVFVERWTADPSAKVAGKARPVNLVDALGALISIGIVSTKTLPAKEAATGGDEFKLSPYSRLLIQRTDQCELIIDPTRLPEILKSPWPGTKITLVLDGPKALEGFRQEDGKLWIPFELQLPVGSRIYFQPELTQKEIDEGCIRPPLVVGSFALYGPCDGGTGHWSHGKLGHLLRPFAIDFKGEWWCDWVLENGQLWLTCDLKWLQSAERQWPICIDPTLGNTGIGASDAYLGSNTYCIAAGPFTATEAGTATSVSWYVVYYAGHYPSTLGIYNGAATGSLLKDTAEVTLNHASTANNPDGWNLANLDSGLAFLLNDVMYVAVMTSDSIYMSYDAGTGGLFRGSQTYVAGTLPASMAWDSDYGRIISAYLTYESAGGSPAHLLSCAGAGT